jgi:hypothetical protein
VARITYLRMAEHVMRGTLVPVLDDWVVRHPPPVTVFFRPKDRRVARVRLAVDVATDLFQRLQATREVSSERVAPRPEWYYRRYGRSSRALRT